MNIPQKNWTVAQLGEFCQATSKKWAIDAWLLGRALILAKKKVSAGDWMTWKAANCPGFSDSTLSRWVKLARAVKEPELLDGVRLQQAYTLLEIGTSKEKPTRTAGDETPDEETPTKREDAQAVAYLSKKIVERLTAMEGSPKSNRWDKIDPAELRQQLTALLVKIQWVLGDLPKRKAS